MTNKDYDQIALPKSIWSILRRHFQDEQVFKHVFQEIRDYLYYSEPALLRDDLNRTRNQYKHIVKAKDLKLFKQKGAKWLDQLPLGYSYHEVGQREYLYRIKTSEEKKDENKKPKISANLRDYLLLVRHVYEKYHISLEKFELTDEEKKQIQKSVSYVFNLRQQELSDDKIESFKRDYKDAYESTLNRVQEKIFIYDYLDNFEEKADILNPYMTAYEDVYRGIEEILKAPKRAIRYTRVFALPLRMHLPENSTQDAVIRKFLEQCSVHVLGHIGRCLKNKWIPEFNKNDLVKNGFYLINRCSRTNQYGVFDQTIWSEFYYYNISGHVKPYLMFIETLPPGNPHYKADMQGMENLFRIGKKRRVPGNPNEQFVKEVDQLIAIDDISKLVKIAKTLPSAKYRMAEKIKALET